MKKISIIFIILFFFSCAAIRERKENSAVNAASKFRYVNLNLIIEYMISNDPDARNLKKHKEDILQKLSAVTEKLANITNELNRNELLEKQNQYKQDLSNIKRDEENFKSKVLNIIDRALENIAKRSDVDFVFDIGEGTVYAKKEYDLTEEVMREILKQKEKSAPVSR